MQIHNVIQGTPEWQELRAKHHTASEAPVMMTASKHMRRDELLAMKKLGIERDVSEYTQKFLFDKGHEAENAIRPHIEKLIGEELYPATGTNEIGNLHLLASFDGITMLQTMTFEHKMWNEELVEMVRNKNLSEQYTWQLDQLLVVSGAKEAIFVVSDGTPDKMVYLWYRTNDEKVARLLNGWRQFNTDLEIYEHIVDAPKSAGKAIMALPTLNVSIIGKVENSNLSVYEKNAIEFIDNINTDLQTDDDFADAEKTVKFCGEAESQLEIVKKQALSQTADIEALFATVDNLKEQMRDKRLTLERLIKSQKESLKNEIVTTASEEFRVYMDQLRSILDGEYMPDIPADFKAAIKGKRTITTLRSAANDELARAKLKANEVADIIRTNRKSLVEMAAEYMFLFNDINTIVEKDNPDFVLLVNDRIAKRKLEEEKRLKAERERIREEEAQRAAEETRIADKKKQAELECLQKEEKSKTAQALPVQNSGSNAKPKRRYPIDAHIGPSPRHDPLQPIHMEAPDTTNSRPADIDIIQVLALHYIVHESMVISWLLQMDLNQTTTLTMEEFGPSTI